jgi:hypothetical protein
MLKGLFIPVLTLLRVLLYSFSALYIKQHTKGVTGIRTGTLKQAKGLYKGLKGLY